MRGGLVFLSRRCRRKKRSEFFFSSKNVDRQGDMRLPTILPVVLLLNVSPPILLRSLLSLARHVGRENKPPHATGVSNVEVNFGEGTGEYIETSCLSLLLFDSASQKLVALSLALSEEWRWNRLGRERGDLESSSGGC